MNWVLQWSDGVTEQSSACMRVPTGSAAVQSRGRKGNGCLSVPSVLPYAFMNAKTPLHKDHPSKYLLLQTKPRGTPVPWNTEQPSFIFSKSKIIVGTRELKTYKGERDPEHCISCTDCNKMQPCELKDFRTSPSKLVTACVRGQPFNSCHSFTFLLLNKPADIKQAPGNLAWSRFFLLLLCLQCLRGGLFAFHETPAPWKYF